MQFSPFTTLLHSSPTHDIFTRKQMRAFQFKSKIQIQYNSQGAEMMAIKKNRLLFFTLALALEHTYLVVAKPRSLNLIHIWERKTFRLMAPPGLGIGIENSRSNAICNIVPFHYSPHSPIVTAEKIKKKRLSL